MSTRGMTMVVERDYASNHVLGFAQNPRNVADNSHVNMYNHHDQYPEWQGIQIANWILANKEILGDGSKLSAKLAHDMWYDSCYLYPSPDDIDHQYTYVIWTGDSKDIWVSCFDQYVSKNVFVLKPNKIIKKFNHERFKDGYTNFAGGETRSTDRENLLHPSGYD